MAGVAMSVAGCLTDSTPTGQIRKRTSDDVASQCWDEEEDDGDDEEDDDTLKEEAVGGRRHIVGCHRLGHLSVSNGGDDTEPTLDVDGKQALGEKVMSKAEKRRAKKGKTEK